MSRYFYVSIAGKRPDTYACLGLRKPNIVTQRMEKIYFTIGCLETCAVMLPMNKYMIPKDISFSSHGAWQSHDTCM
ncbi:hypothetical protein XENTR_v10024558 [Xenopus tropicalis]|nr:hypothetical protein XENTR_v10024558 [Xenopus tropicalis]